MIVLILGTVWVCLTNREQFLFCSFHFQLNLIGPKNRSVIWKIMMAKSLKEDRERILRCIDIPALFLKAK